MADDVLYFSYGSNLDPDRFRSRVGDWHWRRRAVLNGYRLRFSAQVQSEGGGGAIVVPGRRHRVYGAVFSIAPDQLAAMDAEEFAPDRDRESAGSRQLVVVDVDGRPVNAETYTVPHARACRRPSDAYLDHILRGLEDVGWGAEVLDEVRTVAAAEPPGHSSPRSGGEPGSAGRRRWPEGAHSRE